VSFRGLSLLRLEDARFLTGRGRYVEDIDYRGQAWMHVVRSPHANAEIRHIDTAAARALPGVQGVFTAADLANLGRCRAPCRWQALRR
jgi:carbon-monoxide dehydrogenase large subunit